MNRVWYGRVECAFRPLPAIPVGFTKPLQPILSSKVPTGAGWIHELKYDGYRIIGRKGGDIVRLWSRNGINWAHEFPMIVDAIRRLPVDRIVLDCADGHPDFRALRSRQACREARLMSLRPSGPGWRVSDVDAALRAP